ncbi:response regulator [Larkinella bovis]|uniref:Response regulator n=1 Tax=Larkinella bovis TaxID=683041 RepID=A0ABW0IJA5_9BACT
MKPLILVVDDDEDDLWIMQKAMLQIGGSCQLNPFNDGTSLITYLDRSNVVPHLFLIDFHLPRMNGRELTELIRSKGPFKTTPVAWMSSEIDPSWETHCQSLQVSWCWTKPTNYTDWQTFMRQLCIILINRS